MKQGEIIHNTSQLKISSIHTTPKPSPLSIKTPCPINLQQSYILKKIAGAQRLRFGNLGNQLNKDYPNSPPGAAQNSKEMKQQTSQLIISSTHYTNPHRRQSATQWTQEIMRTPKIVGAQRLGFGELEKRRTHKGSPNWPRAPAAGEGRGSWTGHLRIAAARCEGRRKRSCC